MKTAALLTERAKIYQFLATLYHDEISSELFSKLTSDNFISKMDNFLQVCPIQDLRTGLEKIVGFLKSNFSEEDYKNLRYEFADIFLNAGDNPAHPYESVYLTREPMVMQKSVFDVRRFYRKAGVHKSDNYRDLDDHIAVEMEFVRYLLEKMGEEDMRFDDILSMQIEFLREHLMSWIIEFCAVLSNSSQSDFYNGLSDFTMGFLFHERMLIFSLQAGTAASEEYISSVKALSDAISELNLGDRYLTLAEGVKEEEPAKSIPSHCYICGALCGSTVKVKDGIITSIGGLPGDPKGGGRLCPKGANSIGHVYSSYRLKSPLIRENGRFRKASWDEALDVVAQKLKELEPGKVGYFRGNDWNNWLHEALFDHYGAIKTTHRPMCDNPIRMANEHNLNDKRPWIHYKDADYIILFGNNDLATSYGQRKTAMLKAALDRGAKLVVFDPRRSETAASATEWVPVKPATDGAVAMAMCYVIVKNDLYNKDFVENWTYGFDDFRKRLLGKEDGTPRTPEWASKISGVPAETIERIAWEFASSKNKGVICWGGTGQVPNSFYAVQAIHGLNGLMGTYDAPGGPSLPWKRKLKSAWGEGQTKPPSNAPKEKVDKLQMWAGWAPAYFPRDVDEGKFKALVCYFGEPTLSWGNQKAMIEAIKKLDFTVTIDAFMANIAVLSDVVLPDATSFEQSQVKSDWLYDAFIGYFAKSVKPLFDSRPSHWIFIELAKRLGYSEYFPWKDIDEAHRNMLKGTSWSFEELKEKGYIVTDPHEFYKYHKWGGFNTPQGYGSSGKTKTGKYNFKNPIAEEKGIDPLPDYKEPDPKQAPDDEYPFVLSHFRIFEHEHCSTFNNVRLMKLRGTNPLWINQLDASRYGIEEGDEVVLESPYGKITTKAKPTWYIRQGVVAAAGGFGHLRGLEADPKYPQFGGVNTPGIMPPNTSDPVGGTPPLKYVKVKLAKVS